MDEEDHKWRTYLVALAACFSNGFFYSYAIFSTRLLDIVQINPSDVVLLGVLSQTGLGIFQYPTTLLQNRAHIKYGVSLERIDVYNSIFCGVLFLTATCGIGAILYSMENGTVLSRSTVMGILGPCFFMWGQGAGMTFNSCSTLINFNYSDAGSWRRIALVGLSCSVGLGGVALVCIYQLGLRTTTSLNSMFFGLAVYYAVLTVARVLWMKRVKQKVSPSRNSSSANIIAHQQPQQEDTADEQDRVPSPPVAYPVVESLLPTPQPLSALLKSDVVWLTCLGTFIGVGVGGTYLSSLGNLGTQLIPGDDLTFILTLLFLSMQTGGRLINAVAYGYCDWPYIFAFWQIFCLFGVTAFLISPNYTGAYVSSSFVGLSFGGFHSAYPVLAATSFPGNPVVDYSQSVGIALGMTSIGCIAVGQLTTVVYNASSLEDLRLQGFFGAFLFFVALLVVSAISSLVLGKRISQHRRRAALIPEIRVSTDGVVPPDYRAASNRSSGNL